MLPSLCTTFFLTARHWGEERIASLQTPQSLIDQFNQSVFFFFVK